jgi:hypothetical protein
MTVYDLINKLLKRSGLLCMSDYIHIIKGGLDKITGHLQKPIVRKNKKVPVTNDEPEQQVHGDIHDVPRLVVDRRPKDKQEPHVQGYIHDVPLPVADHRSSTEEPVENVTLKKTNHVVANRHVFIRDGLGLRGDEDWDKTSNENSNDDDKNETTDKEKIEYMNNSWIEDYIPQTEGKAKLYDVESNGDCFFATIREAYNKSNSKDGKNKVDVSYLRQIVSNNVTDDELTKYRITNTAGLDTWFNGINTLPELKRQILTSKYWADEFAMGIIERELNIKSIILSRELYTQKQKNIIKYKSLLNPIDNPDKYILFLHTPHTSSSSENHYQLITITVDEQEKGLLDFADIPKKIKDQIIEQIRVHVDNEFNNIYDFKQPESEETTQGGGKKKKIRKPRKPRKSRKSRKQRKPRKSRKQRKSRKSRKQRKPRKSRKQRKSRKSRKPRKPRKSITPKNKKKSSNIKRYGKKHTRRNKKNTKQT